MSKQITFLLNFILLMGVQAFVLNDIVVKSALVIWGIPVFVPMIYPLILLLLPLNTGVVRTMLIGFALGLVMDMFSNTPGMHAASTVLIAYLRPVLLTLFIQQQRKDWDDSIPNLFKMGFQSFLIYTLISLTIHHFFFYFIQIWSLINIHIVFVKTLLSVLFSTLLIILIQVVFTRSELRKA